MPDRMTGPALAAGYQNARRQDQTACAFNAPAPPGRAVEPLAHRSNFRAPEREAAVSTKHDRLPNQVCAQVSQVVFSQLAAAVDSL
jgi:hypothetical protein